jgi:hypothetical protein
MPWSLPYQEAPVTDPRSVLTSLIPAEWFTGEPRITVDREEILVVGVLPDGVAPKAFRELTRDLRVRIAAEVEARFLRKVSWGVQHGDTEIRFTTVSVPVMTRLRIEERAVLDALIEGGIARSRSEALNWCVRLVGRNQREWLDELVEATEAVRKVRERGPDC